MLLQRFVVPTIAMMGVMGGISTYWGMNMYKKSYGMKSELWEDHVETTHSQLEEVAPGLFQVNASYYNLHKYRNMTVLVMPNGNTLIHSPIALPEDAMAKIEALGKPQFLYVPNISNSARVDVSVYQKRYPEAKIIVPEVISEKMKQHVQDAAVAETELKAVDSRFIFITPPLKDMPETIIDAPLATGQRALLAGELFWNLRFFSGLIGKLFVISKLAGDGIQPQVSSVTRAFGFESPAVRTQFFSDFSSYAQGHLPGTENDVEPVPRYAAMTLQHGNPVTSEVHKKILRVSQAEVKSL